MEPSMVGSGGVAKIGAGTTLAHYWADQFIGRFKDAGRAVLADRELSIPGDA